MPAGYSTRCKVCNSAHRVEAEKWVKEEGISVREVARRLSEFGEKISHEAVRRHMQEHFDVQAEAREQYQKSQAVMEKAVEKHLSDIEMLDNIAQRNYELNEAVATWVSELVAQRGKIPRTLVDLLGVTGQETRQQIKQRQELIGDDPSSKLADAMIATIDDLQERYLNAYGGKESSD